MLKNLRKLTVGALLLVALLTSPGCATTERNAYVTIGSVGATANAAIGAYSTYVQAHGTTVEETQAARRVVQAYVDAMETARHVVAAHAAGAAGTSAVTQALDDLQAASTQLTTLLYDFTKPLTPTQ